MYRHSSIGGLLISNYLRSSNDTFITISAIKVVYFSPYSSLFSSFFSPFSSFFILRQDLATYTRMVSCSWPPSVSASCMLHSLSYKKNTLFLTFLSSLLEEKCFHNFVTLSGLLEQGKQILSRIMRWVFPRWEVLRSYTILDI